MVTYSLDGKFPEGAWIMFSDGHTEKWTDERLKLELSYRGLDFIKSQIIFHKAKIRQLQEKIGELDASDD